LQRLEKKDDASSEVSIETEGQSYGFASPREQKRMARFYLILPIYRVLKETLAGVGTYNIVKDAA
jgi:hypothetical protein